MVEYRESSDGIEVVGTHTTLGFIYHEEDGFARFEWVDADDQDREMGFPSLAEAKAFIEKAGDELVETAVW